MLGRVEIPRFVRMTGSGPLFHRSLHTKHCYYRRSGSKETIEARQEISQAAEAGGRAAFDVHAETEAPEEAQVHAQV